MPRHKTSPKDVLRAVVAHGGVRVSNHQIRSALGEDLVSPVFFALRDLTERGHVSCDAPSQGGVPSSEWTITPAGRAFLEAPSKDGPLVRLGVSLRRFQPRRAGRSTEESRAFMD